MKKLLTAVLVTTTLLLAACENTLVEVKVDGEEAAFTPESTWAYHTTKTFSYPENGKIVMTKTAYTSVVLANFELDTDQAFISLNKQKLDEPGQVKVMFSLTGDKETSVDTPVKPGDYTTDAERFNMLEDVTVYYHADGEKRGELGGKDVKGKVTITGVSGTTISGSIDVTDGENLVRGSFSAEGHESVK